MEFDLSPLEQFCLAGTLLVDYIPPTRTDRRTLRRALEEFGLRGYADDLAIGQFSVSRDGLRDRKPIKVSRDSVAFILERLDKKPPAGPMAAIIADLEDRLIALRDAT